VGYTSGRAGSRSTPDQTEINVKMVAQSKRNIDASLYANQVKRELTERVPGVKVTASEVSIMGGANDAPIQIVMSSTKMDSLIKYAQLVENKTNAVAGIAESKLSYEDGNPELKVQIDKARMTELGLSLEQVGATMQNAFNGNDDSQFKDGEYEYNIKVMLDAFNRRNVEDVKQLNFINNQGQNIELHQFAEVVTSTGSAELRRSERISSITLSAQVVGRPVGTVGEDIKKQIAQLGVPSSIDIAYDGDLKNQADAFGSLGLALVASIILVYLIMVALYDSYIYPFVVLFSIPVALIGALLALALTQNSLNIFSILGIIMLIGLVAKNAILIVDFANQLKAEGKASFEALIEAGQTRLRPILMTTIAMVIGLLPIAIAKGAGAEWKNGLAWALMGGLTSSMVFTLVLVPVVYYMVDLAKEKLQQLKPKKQETLQTA
jgi:HAE1 family hydrophobic/amphiphilic exporter-1